MNKFEIEYIQHIEFIRSESTHQRLIDAFLALSLADQFSTLRGVARR